MAREMPAKFHRTMTIDPSTHEITPTLKVVDISEECGIESPRPPVNLIYTKLQFGIKYVIIEIGLRREELHYEELITNPRERQRLPYRIREIARTAGIDTDRLLTLIIEHAPKTDEKPTQDFAIIGARRP